MTTRPDQGRGDDAPPYRIVLRSEVTDEDATSLWPVYDAVFGDQADFESWRNTAWDRHTRRDGFRLARAYEGGSLVGFAYGYTGERGQWWTERAFEVLEPGDRRSLAWQAL